MNCVVQMFVVVLRSHHKLAWHTPCYLLWFRYRRSLLRCLNYCFPQGNGEDKKERKDPDCFFIFQELHSTCTKLTSTAEALLKSKSTSADCVVLCGGAKLGLLAMLQSASKNLISTITF